VECRASWGSSEWDVVAEVAVGLGRVRGASWGRWCSLAAGSATHQRQHLVSIQAEGLAQHGRGALLCGLIAGLGSKAREKKREPSDWRVFTQAEIHQSAPSIRAWPLWVGWRSLVAFLFAPRVPLLSFFS